jgi:hypothetical protein
MNNETKPEPIIFTNSGPPTPRFPRFIQLSPEEIKAVKEREAAEYKLPVPVLFPPRD